MLLLFGNLSYWLIWELISLVLESKIYIKLCDQEWIKVLIIIFGIEVFQIGIVLIEILISCKSRFCFRFLNHQSNISGLVASEWGKLLVEITPQTSRQGLYIIWLNSNNGFSRLSYCALYALEEISNIVRNRLNQKFLNDSSCSYLPCMFQIQKWTA